MKKIIDGKTYNTQTAECIAEWDKGEAMRSQAGLTISERHIDAFLDSVIKSGEHIWEYLIHRALGMDMELVDAAAAASKKATQAGKLA